MKKAVITTGGKQYLVTEGQQLDVELMKTSEKVQFQPLLIIDGDKTEVGTPVLTDRSVVADVVSEDLKTEKVLAIRYKSKKRVHKIHGHRQHKTTLKIASVE